MAQDLRRFSVSEREREKRDLGGAEGGGEAERGAEERGKMPAARVLVVDDEKGILDSMERIFRKEGHEVVTASNGKEALDVLRGGGVDVVVTDLMMPGASAAEHRVSRFQDRGGCFPGFQSRASRPRKSDLADSQHSEGDWRNHGVVQRCRYGAL